METNMENRIFGIPAIALGFTALTLTGCPVDDDKDDEDEDSDTDSDTDDGGGGGSSIDGSWSLDSYSYNGENIELEYSYEYNGYSYSSTQSIDMTIASPSVSLDISSTYYTDNAAYSSYNGTESYSYSGSITDNGSSYGIAIDDSITMDCTLSGSSLSCAGNSDYTGLDLEFSR